LFGEHYQQIADKLGSLHAPNGNCGLKSGHGEGFEKFEKGLTEAGVATGDGPPRVQLSRESRERTSGQRGEHKQHHRLATISKPGPNESKRKRKG